MDDRSANATAPTGLHRLDSFLVGAALAAMAGDAGPMTFSYYLGLMRRLNWGRVAAHRG